MQQRPTSFSLYAFITALLVHVIVFLLLLMIERITPTPPPQTKEEKPQEARFKVSLKEQPKAVKEALVKNDIPKITKARPLPKGEQLDKQTPPKSQPKVVTKPPVEPPKPSQQPSVATPSTPPEPKKAFERHIAKTVATIERKPQKEQGLYDILSKQDSNEPSSSSPSPKVGTDIKKLYGDKFGELSEGEQKYIIDNFEKMRRITQGVLTRYARSRIPDNFRAKDINIIEFYLYPDRHISDVRFVKNSQFYILDDTTKETIEIAYKDYPRPEQKTYIRYQVFYELY